jgi:hypothetical protein
MTRFIVVLPGYVVCFVLCVILYVVAQCMDVMYACYDMHAGNNEIDQSATSQPCMYVQWKEMCIVPS